MDISLSYWSSYYSKEQATSIASTFEKAIISLASQPRQSVHDMPLVSDQGMDQIHEWNSQIPTAVDKCIHRQFEEQAELRPGSMAVCSNEVNLTYRELDALASALSAQLVRLGVGTNVFVPYCFEKSPWTVVALLAILKAGGCCVALDPKHPRDRLEGIIQDVNASVIVTAPHLCSLFDGFDGQVMSLDPTALRASLISTSKLASDRPVTPNDPAFVVFTSGSTGKPKGIVLQHSALCTTVLHHGISMNIGPGSRVLQFAAYTFDVSIGEILVTLIRGGTVCVPTDHERFSDLAGFINRMGVDWAYLTPSVASTLHPSQVPGLRTLALGGEAVKQESVTVWANAVQLINVYGPAECSIWSTCQPGVTSTTSPSNIGRGVGSLNWIVDANNHKRLCPVGAVGELLIEGPILAEGYLNLPERTAAAFVSDMPWSGANCRMYKTGDLVRYTSSGEILYVSRRDTQVKLRGQRIELGEVEHHIKVHIPTLSDVAVDMVQLLDGTRGNALVAFFTTSTDNAQSGQPASLVHDLLEDTKAILIAGKAALTTSLPSYMLPSFYFPLSSMPLSTSGKLDRKRLRKLIADLSEETFARYSLATSSQRQPLTTPMEHSLRDLWVEVFKTTPELIGSTENFFSIGGDSISAMQLVAAAAKANFTLSVADIFRHPELYQMASVMQFAANAEVKPVLPFSLLGPGSPSKEAVIQDINTTYKISANTIEDVYPCTPLQEGLMMLSDRKPGSYMNQQCFSLPASIDMQRFTSAWNQTMQALPILRTTVVNTKDGTRQVVIRSNIKWIYTDSTSIEEYLHQDLAHHMSYGHDLARYAVITVKNKRYFVWTIHHALYDGLSIPIILEYFIRAYKGVALFQTGPFNAYVQFICESSTDASTTFWTKELSDTSASHFPQITDASSYHCRADKRLQHHITLSMKPKTSTTIAVLVRAAWALVLSEYSNSDDVVFGAIVTGRNIPVKGIETIVGPTMATVPVVVSVRRNMTVSEYLDSISSQAAAMMPHEHFGLQNIEKLGSSPRRACKFQNLLVVQPKKGSGSESELLGMEPLPQEEFLTDTFPMTVECHIGTEGVDLEAIYDAQVVPSIMMERILKQLDHAVCRLAEAVSNEKLSAISMLGTHDMQQILAWNSILPPKVESCVHEIFGQRAAQHPDRPAISAWDGKLSYFELDNISTQLAVDLMARGIGPETKVPICFEKSAWTSVAIFGVLKAGAAFVLLDPSHPLQRLSLIVEDTGATLVVSSEKQSSICRALGQKAFILKPTTYKINRMAHSQWVPSTVTPGNAAYAVFTSGTTGKPKGVVVEHSAYCTAAKEHGDALFLDSDSRVLQFASYSFDGAMVETLTTLLRGGCVCVPSEEDRTTDMVSFFNKHRVNHAMITPSFARLLQPDMIPHFRTLVLVGEAMTRQDVATWSHLKRFMNGYGPSECCVCASVNIMTPQSDTSNIGRAVGARNWIVNPDDHNRLVPIGCVGELVVEGHTLARGYLNDQIKTEASFITDPAWAASESTGRPRRFYKTGDLVKYNDSAASGDMIFCGRKDQQVKLHGQRMELGEIEQVLSTMQHVYQGLVLLPRAGACKDRLVAIISLKSNIQGNKVSDHLQLVEGALKPAAAAKATWIRDQLFDKLPGFMVPPTWIVLESIPFSSSSKVDRAKVARWVADIDESTFDKISDYILADSGPQESITATHIAIRAVLAVVLKLPADELRLDRSFLSIGGDSITAVQVVSQCRQQGIVFTVKDLLQSKSIARIADMATSLDSPDHDKKSLVNVRIDEIDDDMESFLETVLPQVGLRGRDDIQAAFHASSSEEEILQHCDKSPKSGFYEAEQIFKVSISGKPPSGIGIYRLLGAWQAVVDRHASLRTIFVKNPLRQNRFEHLVLAKCDAPVEIIHCATEKDLRTALQRKPYAGHSQAIPKHNFLICTTGDGQVLAKLDIHHSLFDAPSILSIFKDLERAYGGDLALGQAPTLREYNSHVERLGQKSALEYWQVALKDAQPCFFPVDKAKASRDGGKKLQTVDMKIGNAAKLSSFCETHEVTLPSVAYTIWTILLQWATHSDDVCFGYLSSARTNLVGSMSETAGFLVDHVISRSADSTAMSAMELLHQIHNNNLASISHQHISPSDIGKSLDIQMPLFNTLINFRKFEGQDLSDDTSSESWSEEECLKGNTIVNKPRVVFKPISSADPMAVSLICFHILYSILLTMFLTV